MASTGVKVVILVGGENRATRFRPLSLDLPKPLFPIAGKAMIAHHIEACKQLKNLEEILILGSFDENKFTTFINEMSQKHNLKIRYAL
jgi:mannose-1-phosphate guanylyltransferase